MRAGHRRIFNDRYGRLIVSHGHFRQSIGFHQFAGRHSLRYGPTREKRRKRNAKRNCGERDGSRTLAKFATGDLQLRLLG
jgi:hypothetical protein